MMALSSVPSSKASSCGRFAYATCGAERRRERTVAKDPRMGAVVLLPEVRCWACYLVPMLQQLAEGAEEGERDPHANDPSQRCPPQPRQYAHTDDRAVHGHADQERA